MSTTRWHYNQGNCILAHNPPIYAHCFFSKFTKCGKPTFTKSSHAISSICTKPCTHHLWTLLTALNLLYNNFLYILLKTQSVAYLHIGLSEWHLRWLLPHEPLRLCAKFWPMITRWCSLNWNIWYFHIGWVSCTQKMTTRWCYFQCKRIFGP